MPVWRLRVLLQLWQKCAAHTKWTKVNSVGLLPRARWIWRSQHNPKQNKIMIPHDTAENTNSHAPNNGRKSVTHATDLTDRLPPNKTWKGGRPPPKKRQLRGSNFFPRVKKKKKKVSHVSSRSKQNLSTEPQARTDYYHSSPRNK